MGVTIHYRGRLRSPADIQPFTNELADICRSTGWKYDLYHFTEPDVRGVIFKPHPESESVTFVFLEDGTLTNFMALKLCDEAEMPWAFCKTQFAGVDTHVALCKLFQYLQKKWFSTFEVMDESDFYETGNRKKLERQIEFLGTAITSIAEGLEGAALEKGETLEQRILKIIAPLHRRWLEEND